MKRTSLHPEAPNHKRTCTEIDTGLVLQLPKDCWQLIYEELLYDGCSLPPDKLSRSLTSDRSGLLYLNSCAMKTVNTLMKTCWKLYKFVPSLVGSLVLPCFSKMTFFSEGYAFYNGPEKKPKLRECSRMHIFKATLNWNFLNFFDCLKDICLAGYFCDKVGKCCFCDTSLQTVSSPDELQGLVQFRSTKPPLPLVQACPAEWKNFLRSQKNLSSLRLMSAYAEGYMSLNKDRQRELGDLQKTLYSGAFHPFEGLPQLLEPHPLGALSSLFVPDLVIRHNLPQLMHLTRLSFLKIRRNSSKPKELECNADFQDRLTKWFINLTDLKTLNIPCNRIVGSDALSALTRLESLNLSSSRFFRSTEESSEDEWNQDDQEVESEQDEEEQENEPEHSCSRSLGVSFFLEETHPRCESRVCDKWGHWLERNSLSSLVSLKTLNLVHTNLSSMEGFSILSNLISLSLRRACWLRSHLEFPPNLTQLDIRGTAVPLDALAHLRSLINLGIEVAATKDHHLNEHLVLRNFPNLQNLTLRINIPLYQPFNKEDTPIAKKREYKNFLDDFYRGLNSVNETFHQKADRWYAHVENQWSTITSAEVKSKWSKWSGLCVVNLDTSWF